MAEDKEQRTEQATPRRREEAIEAGNIPRSRDLTAAVLMLCGVLVIHIMGDRILTSMSDMMRAMLGGGYWADSREMLDNLARLSIGPIVIVMAPIMATLCIAAFLANFYQSDFQLTMHPPKVSLSRLNFIAGFSRLFAGANMFTMVMNLAKLIVIGTVIAIRIQQFFPRIMALGGLAFPANFFDALNMIYDLTLKVTVTLLILALIDWIYQKTKFERDIRMTKQEVKDESKMMEGDMSLKAKRRAMGRKMIMQRVRTAVPTADVVITNPTHLAIALKYDPAKMNAPVVVAKGADNIAMTIRQIAMQHGIPIIERKPLAQALYKSVEPGQEIPSQFYQSIAEILAYVFEISGKMKRMKKSA